MQTWNLQEHIIYLSIYLSIQLKTVGSIGILPNTRCEALLMSPHPLKLQYVNLVTITLYSLSSFNSLCFSLQREAWIKRMKKWCWTTLWLSSSQVSLYHNIELAHRMKMLETRLHSVEVCLVVTSLRALLPHWLIQQDMATYISENIPANGYHHLTCALLWHK